MTSPPPTPTGPVHAVEVRSLTGLRLVAALWVVLFHWSFTPGREYSALRSPNSPLFPLVHYGYLGVDVFYVLSGFVITLSYLPLLGPRLSPTLSLQYLWARFVRIWPAYVTMTLLFGLWLEYVHLHNPLHPLAYQTVQPSLAPLSWVEQILMVQQWARPYTDGSSFIGACWSVSAEVLAYVLFPLLALLLYRLRRLPAPLLLTLSLLAAAPLALHALAVGNPYFAWSWAARLSSGFLAGAFSSLFVSRVSSSPLLPPLRRLAPTLSLLTLLEIVLILVWASHASLDRSATATLLFPLLVTSLALSPSGLASLLSRPLAQAGGKASYSLYLVHIPILEIFWTEQYHPRLAPGGPYAELVVPNLIPLALLAAWILYHRVEEPMRSRLRALLPARTHHPPPHLP